MKKYYVEIDGIKIEVSKEVSDVVRGNSGESRHERYIIEELAPKYELSLEGLQEAEFPVEQHMVKKNLTTEEMLLQRYNISVLKQAIRQLTDDELFIINSIVLHNMSERDLEPVINVPRSTIGYKKRKILEKLKKLYFYYENLSQQCGFLA